MTEPFPFYRQLWSGIELEEADDCICIRLRREGDEDPVELFIPARCAATAGTALLEVALGRWQAERVKRRLGYDGICVPATSLDSFEGTEARSELVDNFAKTKALMDKVEHMTPEEIFQISVRAGIHNPDGSLTKEYGGAIEPGDCDEEGLDQCGF